MCDTFIISSSECTSECASSTCFPIWNLLQIYQSVGQRLSVHIEDVSAVFFLPWFREHQSQFKQEYMQPLTQRHKTQDKRLSGKVQTARWHLVTKLVADEATINVR